MLIRRTQPSGNLWNSLQFLDGTQSPIQQRCTFPLHFEGSPSPSPSPPPCPSSSPCKTFFTKRRAHAKNGRRPYLAPGVKVLGVAKNAPKEHTTNENCALRHVRTGNEHDHNATAARALAALGSVNGTQRLILTSAWLTGLRPRLRDDACAPALLSREHHAREYELLLVGLPPANPALRAMLAESPPSAALYLANPPTRPSSVQFVWQIKCAEAT